MIGLLCLFLVLVTAPCKSKSRLEAENAALRHQLIVFSQDAGAGPAHEQRSLVLYPAVSMVPVDPEGSYDHPTRDARALASGRISPLVCTENLIHVDEVANRLSWRNDWVAVFIPCSRDRAMQVKEPA